MTLCEQTLSYLAAEASAPHLIARCRGINKQFSLAADEPELWIGMNLPTGSTLNRQIMHQLCEKVDKSAVRHSDEFQELPRATVVCQGVTPGNGSTVLCDALCGQGTCHVSRSDLQGPAYQNDVIVRGFAAQVEGATWWGLTKDRRTTAMASPFAAALYR
eukprot:TRINITY_DN18186_c0_g1_i2.p1 TRINITY_DN18186_c0_g1~~TRINITY_DN18186_c0_g1_i2.p1  ORF type:complete len:160 (+),score=25.92 TRINITY_DN18186_c0_g1_i2:106-585(+)